MIHTGRKWSPTGPDSWTGGPLPISFFCSSFCFLFFFFFPHTCINCLCWGGWFRLLLRSVFLRSFLPVSLLFIVACWPRGSGIMYTGEFGFNCWEVMGPALVLFLFYVNVSGMRQQSRLSSQPLTILAP